MVTYRSICMCRCVRMCIHAQELVYWENKDVLQTETREFTDNVHFSMMMNAGIAHYFFSNEENEVPVKWKIKQSNIFQACHVQLPFLSLLHLPQLSISGVSIQFCLHQAFFPNQHILFSLKLRPLRTAYFDCYNQNVCTMRVNEMQFNLPKRLQDFVQILNTVMNEQHNSE